MIKIAKWVFLGLAGLLVIAVIYVTSTRDTTNARVAREIHENPQGERAHKTLLLTLADERMYPVNFLHEGRYVYLGIDGLWWRDFVDAPQPVRMFIRGRHYRGSARTILDDPELKADVFSRLRPTVPAWLPDALNGKLVVVTLEE